LKNTIIEIREVSLYLYFNEIKFHDRHFRLIVVELKLDLLDS